MSMRWGRQTGFTIVELLIVIAVIGILAAIVIVAYNGIQTKASNTQTTQAVASYIKALKLYGVDNGALPVYNSCLGDQYDGGNCLSLNKTAACFGTGGAMTNADFVTAIKPYLGGHLPMPSTQKASCGGTQYVGAYYHYAAGAATAAVYMILKGQTDCPNLGGLTASAHNVTDSATRCYYALDAPS